MPKKADFTPIYAQIGDFVRQSIESGQYAPGDRLPSEKELTEQFGTTRATVARALQKLVYEGLVQRRPGSGSFVRQADLNIPLETTRIRSFDEQMASSGERVSYRLIGFRAESCRSACEALGLAAEDTYLLERLRLVNDAPLSLERRYMSKTIGDRLSVRELNTMSIHRILAEVLQDPVVHIHGNIRVGSATPEIAELLEITRGSPLLIRDYVLSNAASRPLIYGESVYKEQFRIPYQVHQVEGK
ncbi:GntR family transcriptional regulator [Billgrantia endophytica]|uniref:HTH gntR-type domain-containing protein n=1 Tax=Billgrantia endophytica TaxID=2033802 RepID=A0A2N7U7S5_9GAMM|nr:GntR family transcriptional regulator [Halomonas endophytica]PMR76481.1 hypothetical protein C1H69_05405 [Halomonas endophytica]